MGVVSARVGLYVGSCCSLDITCPWAQGPKKGRWGFWLETPRELQRKMGLLFQAVEQTTLQRLASNKSQQHESPWLAFFLDIRTLPCLL